MRLSILIVNWNTRDDLARCLDSVGDLRLATRDLRNRISSLESHTSSLEVIVVDNASTDGSAAMVREGFPWVTLLEPGENLGYAEGNNLAAEHATGEYLFFLNPDTVVPKEAPERLVRFLQEHPKAGLVAPRLVSPDGSTQASVRGMPSPAAVLGAIVWLDRLLPAHPVWAGYRLPRFDYDKTQRAPQPMASAWMVRRAAWEDVGSFDPGFPLFFNDVDWCLRAQEKGWEVWYDAEACVEHRGGASTSQVKPEATRESHRALVAFTCKHYGKRLGPLRLTLYGAALNLAGNLRAFWYGRRMRSSE